VTQLVALPALVVLGRTGSAGSVASIANFSSWLFNNELVSVQVSAVCLVNRVLRIHMVLKLDEGVAALHDDFCNLSVLSEKIADVPLVNIVADTANINLDGVISSLGHIAVTVGRTIALILLVLTIVGAFGLVVVVGIG